MAPMTDRPPSLPRRPTLRAKVCARLLRRVDDLTDKVRWTKGDTERLQGLLAAIQVIQGPAGDAPFTEGGGALGDLVAWTELDPEPAHGEDVDAWPEVDPQTGRPRIGFALPRAR